MLKIYYVRGMGLDVTRQHATHTVEFLRHRNYHLSHILAPHQVVMCPLDGSGKKTQWMPTLYNEDLSVYDVVIGHSSGVHALLTYAETKKLKKVILLAATDMHNECLQEIETGFFNTPWDYARIKNNCEKILICNGALDPHIPVQQAKDLGKKLSCEVLIFKEEKHLSQWHTALVSVHGTSCRNTILKRVVDLILSS